MILPIMENDCSTYMRRDDSIVDNKQLRATFNYLKNLKCN